MPEEAADQVVAVLIESSGNQAYIFDTNKRAENVGASELIARLGDWTRSALQEIFPGWDKTWQVPARPAELLLAAGGGATVLFADSDDRPAADIGRRLVSTLTLRALREAPGLDVCGVVGEPFAWAEPGTLAGALGAIHRLHPRVRQDRPTPDQRHLRLPIVAGCATSGLPVTALTRDPDADPGPSTNAKTNNNANTIEVSAPAKAKADARDAGMSRMSKYLGWKPAEKHNRFRKFVTLLDDDGGWVGVVHADGNRLGQRLGTLGEQNRDNRAYADALAAFSTAVDRCARAALRAAAPAEAQLLPLIVGGDDLTALVEGKCALEFAAKYLAAFERESASTPELGGLTASAGVALVKGHFPFSAAYRLAEDLTAEAKRGNGDGARSTLSFHVLHDSSADSLAEIRARQVGPAGAPLTTQPYAMSATADGPRWDQLLHRIEVVKKRDDDNDRIVPNSQLHELRAALFRGGADALHDRLLTRYRDLAKLPIDGLLDVMTAAEFVGSGGGDR